MTTTPPLAPADLLAIVNEAEHPAQARHVAGQLAMSNPRAAHAMSIFCQLDQRGQEAMINCGVFHLRYPREK